MVDLKVIEGGGEGDNTSRMGWARHWFAEFTVEFLRSIARGDDYRAAEAMQLFLDEISKENLTVGEVQLIVREQAAHLAKAAEGYRDVEHDRIVSDVLQRSFQVVAERGSLDAAAKGRAGQRERRLDDSLRAFAEWLGTRRVR